MKYLPRIFAHAAVVLALVLLTLLVFDYFNPSMDFINNAITKVMVSVFCVVSLINAALMLIARYRG